MTEKRKKGMTQNSLSDSISTEEETEIWLQSISWTNKKKPGQRYSVRDQEVRTPQAWEHPLCVTDRLPPINQTRLCFLPPVWLLLQGNRHEFSTSSSSCSSITRHWRR